MIYYHVRYHSIPVPPTTSTYYEEWISTEEATTCSELKAVLGSKLHAGVEVTLCRQITFVDFTNKRQNPPVLITKIQLDAKNLALWNLDEVGRVSRKLDDDELKSDARYRNIDKPNPLL